MERGSLALVPTNPPFAEQIKMKQKFFLVLVIDGGETPKFPDRVGRWTTPCRNSIWRENAVAWLAKARELAAKQGFQLGDRFARWPKGWQHRACVYGATDFRRPGTISRCTSPFYLPARPLPNSQAETGPHQ
jgi:hypothetical protein